MFFIIILFVFNIKHLDILFLKCFLWLVWSPGSLKGSSEMRKLQNSQTFKQWTQFYGSLSIQCTTETYIFSIHTHYEKIGVPLYLFCSTKKTLHKYESAIPCWNSSLSQFSELWVLQRNLVFESMMICWIEFAILFFF